jgi:hypothetical protein
MSRIGQAGSGPEGSRLGQSELRVLVLSGAHCARSSIDPDRWFPVSATVAAARREALSPFS